MATQNKPKKERCLTEDADGERCKRTEKTCGLCDSCYATFKRLESKGLVDRKKLEEEGKIKPRKGTRGVSDFFLGKATKAQ